MTPPRVVPAADRLRRLRRLLTVLFTLLNAAGLMAFAWLALSTDSQRREERLDGELHRVTSAVARLIRDDGAVITAFVGQDELNTECPQFAILPVAAGQFVPYGSGRRCVPVDTVALRNYAARAVSTSALINGYGRDGSGRLVRIGAEPFRGRNGQYVGAVVAVTDAQVEQDAHNRWVLIGGGGTLLLVLLLGGAGYLLAGRAIRPAAAALEQQEVLLAETAHDLRTPVAALRALAEAAQQHPDGRRDLLPRTVRLAARMGGIIDGLLVRARLAAGVQSAVLQPVWLDQLVAGVVEENPTEYARVAVATAPSKVVADPALVQRAVTNLIDNALRHGHGPDDEAVVHVTVAGGRVTVADHGPGIDPSAAEETFDRFASGAGSTGLGLSIVRWVALAHGGTLRVYNGEEGGAIFELQFPETR